MLSKSWTPTSEWTISLPLNRNLKRTLSPSSMNSLAFFSFTSISCFSIVAVKRISFISTCFWFFFASFAFLSLSNLNLPKSIILQTGGSAFGEISTKSKPFSKAKSIAFFKGSTPSWSPDSLITLTSLAVISSFFLISYCFAGGLLLSILYSF